MAKEKQVISAIEAYRPFYSHQLVLTLLNYSEYRILNVSLKPVSSRVWQRIKGYRALEDAADSVISVSPAESMPLPEAIYLPDQLDRVTGAHSMAASLADEFDQTITPRLNNIETRAFLIRNAVIGDGRISTWTSFKDLSLRPARRRPLFISEELETAALCSTWQGNDYFAHFLVDDAATHALAGKFAEPFFSGNDAPRTAHSLDYMSRFEIEYIEKHNMRVRELWLFRDFSLGPDKRRRLQRMTERVKAATPAAQPAPGAFIRRGVTGQVRLLDNADEIEAWCVAQGFVIVDPERQSVDEICAALKEIPLVIGVEGSHLVHALFSMATGGTIICIQPANRFNVIFRHLCAAFNLRWGFVVTEGTVDGFRLELDQLKATLDLAHKRLASAEWN